MVTIVQEQLSKAGYHVACLIAIFIFDIFTIIMNSIAVRYCGRKFEQLQGKTTLNARYQVKEACDIANAMQHVYIGSFIFKSLIFTIVIGSCYKVNSSYDCEPFWFSLPFEYLELIYVLGFTAASMALSICFMLMHPRLRRKAAILRQKFWTEEYTDKGMVTGQVGDMERPIGPYYGP
ncbi:hypothetical protein PRIPAC_76997 [Pristionchus pacificus]|uniref:Uncharacterized protein n=1 Tax=Pristionchus pacificus TaxID=54126 RepID=A0A2A6C3B6_PRIPA|nr:hypothetical protein PRIPAC_76997 [Pristionchus pacificus]|eukprot:PDM72597.1 hypothetical protein PRIPAC_39031 [Pristionchus pacificus]